MRHLYPQKLQEFEKEYYVPAQKFPQFSKDDITAFIEGFRMHDIDGSGSISSKELELVFVAMGQGSSKELIDHLIQTYDANGSGEIEWPEFLQIMADVYGGVSLKEKAQPAKPAQPTQPAKPVAVQPTQPAKPVAVQPTQVVQPTQAAAQTKPVGFQPAKPAAPGSPKVQAAVGAQRGNPSCASCGKTVYPIESISAVDKVWHKACFRCEAEGCNLSLNLKNVTAVKGSIYCAKHAPKEKPTAVAADGNLVTANAIAAPKLAKTAGIQKNMRMTFGADEMPEKKS